MAYVSPNFKSKKALKEAVRDGKVVTVFQPGQGTVPESGWVHGIEGPHYPEPHRWYAEVRLEGGRVVQVK